MEDGKTSENHLTSAAAFVEGGIQDACDDACSICLEAFCESDPSTVTGCKHEFHLQCILEWCQRSSQCPMCWQLLSLKDPSSQELLDAVIQERSIRNKPTRSATIFHPTLGEFELQHLPAGATDAELEERIIQHLAAAAAMGRARHIARRERSRNRSSAQGHPHFLLFTTQANTTSPSRDGGESVPAMAAGSPISSASGPATDISASGSASSIPAANVHGNISTSRRSTSQSSPSNVDRAGPSELQSFSESWKSRINAMSTRYKESITKSTRGWKERLFSRGPNFADLGPEAGREVDTSIATVACMMDQLETRETSRDLEATPNNSLDLGPPPEQASEHVAERSVNGVVGERNLEAAHAASSSLD